jgi:hypothetical protein
MINLRLPPSKETNGKTQTVFVIMPGSYAIRAKKLMFADPFWRDLQRAKTYFYEQVHESEIDAVTDALIRARIRRDELNDTIIGLQSRLDALRSSNMAVTEVQSHE